MPADWKILLAIPDLPAGASGGHEADIFRRFCPVPLDEVRALTHEVMMRMLPGIVERDLDLFGSSINTIQGLGFKKVELELSVASCHRPSLHPARGRRRRGRYELVRPCGLRHRGYGNAGPRAGSTDIHGRAGLRRNNPSHHGQQPRRNRPGCVRYFKGSHNLLYPITIPVPGCAGLFSILPAIGTALIADPFPHITNLRHFPNNQHSRDAPFFIGSSSGIYSVREVSR